MSQAQARERERGEAAEPPGPLNPGGRDEMNIAEFPISLLCDRAPRGRNTIEFSDKIVDPQSGREIARMLTITAPEKYGLPTSTDDDVILSLLQLTKQQNNFTRPEVTFTRRQLIELLGWADKGSSYARVAQSLDRWASTYLKYQNAWWDNKERQWTSGGFHIIDSFEVNDGRSARRRDQPPRSHVVWGKVFFRSCRAGYLKSLDYGLYVRLNYHTSKRMYRFLDKRFYHKPEWTFELRDFAFEHIGLSRAYAHNGKIKEKLQPAIEELEGRGFLEPLPPDLRFRRVGRNWFVRFRCRREPGAEAAGVGGVGGPAPADPLVGALVERGVTEFTARELVRQSPAGRVAAKIEVFDWLREKDDRRARKSPAGYLVESIRRDYAAPKGFVPRAERERREAERREAERKAHEERAGKAREDAQARLGHAAVLAYWESLSAAEQAALDEAALAEADPSEREEHRLLPAFERMYRTHLRHEYIRKRLREQPPAGSASMSGARTSSMLSP